MKKLKKKGFTLTEILVVVLIIAILAAVVYPLYTKSITKSRAVEAVNLLEMVRNKQLQEFARRGEYFDDFSNIGPLTTDKSNESISGKTLKVKDYTLSLNTATKCMSANYKKGATNFTFSTSYESAGLGCTGSICTSFGDIVGEAQSVCNCGSKVCTGGFTRNEETCECECNKTCNNGSTCSDVSGGGLTRPCPAGTCGTQTSTASCNGAVWSGSCSSEYLNKSTSQSCSNGGTQYRSCSADCNGGTCGAWGECVGGTVDCTGTKPSTSASCGNCGTKTRSVSCNNTTGVWEAGSWGSCVEGNCPVTKDCTGSRPSESSSCGTCGTKTRSVTCDNSTGNWITGEWGTCNEGNCSTTKECTGSKPSASEACGRCGNRTRSVTCNTSTGTWTTGTWSACSGQGECMPGLTMGEICMNGSRWKVCGDDCKWGEPGPCRECEPGNTAKGACGKCGTRTMTCSSEGSWGPWSSCTGEGECSPGQVGTSPCGLNKQGTRKRTCSSSCSWGAWSLEGCKDAPSCEPNPLCEDCGGTWDMRKCTCDCGVYYRNGVMNSCTFGRGGCLCGDLWRKCR